MKSTSSITRIAVASMAVTILLSADAPAEEYTHLSYQGRIAVGSEPFAGEGHFKFAVVTRQDSLSVPGHTTLVTLWSNDGSSSGGGEPEAAVPLEVQNGMYSVVLGDSGIMEPLPAGIFQIEPVFPFNYPIQLRVWFNDGVEGFQRLTPDQPFTPSAYALRAGTVRDGAITTDKIADGAVTAEKIADEAVTADKIADGAIETRHLAADAVTEEKIAPGALGGEHLADGSVTTSKIQPGTVTGEKIAPGSVSSDHLQKDSVTGDALAPGSVLTEHLASAAVTAEKLAPLSVDQQHIAPGAIGSIHLAPASITSEKVAPDAVTADHLANAAVESRHIAEDVSIEAGMLADGAVTEAAIADGAVTGPKIAEGAITARELGSEAVDTEALADGAVTTEHLADGAVTAFKLAEGAVDAAKLADDAVTTEALANASVTDEKIQLEAIGSDHIAPGAILQEHLAEDLEVAASLADGSVTTSKLVNAAVTAAKLADAAVENIHLADNAVTASNLTAGSVTTVAIADQAVVAETIAAASVGSPHLAGGAVTAGKIAPGAVDATALALAAVGAPHIQEGAIENFHFAEATISDSFLDTIVTPGKIANSATTATPDNAPNTIVLRDEAGNFAAGVITADLTGTASGNVIRTGDSMTGTLAAPLFVSTAPDGTPPLEVASTTLVENLNAEMLGGYRVEELNEMSTEDPHFTGDAWFEGDVTIDGGLLVAPQSLEGWGDTFMIEVPDGVDPDGTVMGVAVAGEEKLRLNASGDLSIGNSLTLGGQVVSGVTPWAWGGVPMFSVVSDGTPIMEFTGEFGFRVGDGNFMTNAPWGTVSGGVFNSATGYYSTVSGGSSNSANGDSSTVGGGEGNLAGSLATVGGGGSNSAPGFGATIPGGKNNIATGDFSFAAGRAARASHHGSFVWADSSGSFLESPDPDSFTARASGGFTFYSDPDATTGVHLAPGSGSWSSASDRELKGNFAEVDPRELLNRLVALPVSTWNYKTQDASIRHIGPTAQDFYAAFEVGEDDTTINQVNSAGVAMAALQGLHEKLTERNAALESALRQRDAELAALRDEIALLANLVDRYTGGGEE